MSLYKQFEDSGKEVYQVTQNEWVTIMTDHFVNTCGHNLENVEKYDTIEFKCYHQENVKRALKSKLDVSEEVLNDYPSLKKIIQIEDEREQERIERINNIPVLTDSTFNLLNVGNKITVNGQKFTIHKKEDQSIIARLYRKQNQAMKLHIGERYSIIVGWE